MIENINDFLSFAMMIGVLAAALYFELKSLRLKRIEKLIEKEARYYREWEE